MSQKSAPFGPPKILRLPIEKFDRVAVSAVNGDSE